MGWYTFVEGEMYFCKETWQHKEDVLERIEDNKKEIEAVKLEIAILVAGRAKDLIQTRDCEDNDIDIPMVIRWKLDELWERLEDASYENWKLEFLLENWDKRYGDFINNPLSPHNHEFNDEEPKYPNHQPFDQRTPFYDPPIQSDDMNPGILLGGDSDISDQAQLKLEFDASIEETHS